MSWSEKRFEGLENLDKYIKEHHQGESEITLRDDQMGVFEEIQLFLKQGGTQGYIKLPTGVGKTVIFTEFLEAFNQRTLIVVPTKLLVDQTGQKIKRFASKIKYGKVYQYQKDLNKQVTIITYSSLVIQVKKGTISPSDYDILILDEVHQCLTTKRVKAVQKFEHAIKIGFTATPRYSNEKNVAHILLGTEICQMGIREAAEKGLVAPFSVIIARTEIDLSDVKISSNGDYDQSALDKSINVESRNQSAIKLYREMFAGKRAVVNALNVKHARQISDMFNKSGIPALMIYGGNKKQEKDDILEKFSKGEIAVLCNVGVLIHGFDEPSAEVCLNLRPTLSQVHAEQRGGRVLRLDPANPKKFAFIVDFLDKNENKKIAPFTFADIVGAAAVFGPDNGDEAKKSGINQKNKRTRESDLEELIKRTEQIKIENLKVVVKSTEVLRIVKETRNQRYKNAKIAPKEWKTTRALTQELHTSYGLIMEIVSPYRVQHPEWFNMYMNVTGRPYEHFHPELIMIIKNHLDEDRKEGFAPDGWKTKDALRKELHIAFRTLEEALAEHKLKNPEYFRTYVGKRNKRSYEWLHPDLVKTIREIYKDRSGIGYAPEGWMIISDLVKDLKSGTKKLKEMTDHYRVSNPEWFKLSLDSKGKPREFMHPQLIKIIKNEFAEKRKIGYAPEGWMTVDSLSVIFNTPNPGFIKYRLKKHRSARPDGFKTFLNDRNHLVEYISPSLISIISQEINDRASEV